MLASGQLLVGDTLDGRYQILSELGTGGMGEVYLVENLQLRRREALKILHADFAGDAQFARRFLREGRAAGRLNHPNIVAAYELGQLQNGTLFLTMEVVEGPSVADEVRRTSGMPLGDALGILAQLTRAVAHAHERGVVHRDLKPENLVLSPRSTGAELVKVLDFGIAKIVAPDYHTSGLTVDGQVFGTPQYMAPEAFSGESTNHRVDLYAIGCIAYELIVGRPPFEGTVLQITMAHLAQAAPVPSATFPELPAEYDALVARCMAKQPDERYQSAAELMLAIAAVPGFDERLRRRVVALPPPPAPLAPARPRPPAGEDSTEERTFVDESARGPDSLAQTSLLSAEDLAPVRQTTMRQLCELLLSLGGGLQSLQEIFAELRSAEQVQGKIDGELVRLDDEALRIEVDCRAEEQALRGRIDALRDAVEDAGRPVPELDRQLEEHELLLRAQWIEAERKSGALSEQLIELTAARATTEDRMAAIYTRLAVAADEVLPRFAGHPKVAPVVGRLQNLNRIIASASKSS